MTAQETRERLVRLEERMAAITLRVTVLTARLDKKDEDLEMRMRGVERHNWWLIGAGAAAVAVVNLLTRFIP